jgi:hypothetical protein
MTLPVHIADLPEPAYEKLAARAKARGVALPDYLRDVLVGAARRATVAEIAAEIAAEADELGPVALDEPSEVTIRRIRDAIR